MYMFYTNEYLDRTKYTRRVYFRPVMTISVLVLTSGQFVQANVEIDLILYVPNVFT
ncbi:hypothetical protein BKA82DRAFT_915728 [Pisolithus tinctorius]|uniref:Uncharacterized protein n=1 Tax=Pisolithus tinctorius Marx 270 TaxID=870435 RepID=A0A0C3MZZ7_PISTI|nr:hypothetical protein BKA82DRAFT_915728 [Pisolithus tinctorius]KIN94439.1 hypothetical protein M404DRAFT_384015 [Pisolithus tinctorius Marx 270]KIN97159.1 hypothetical protein M404DRAFT_915728 [Pisolithus tinctorius Marx 270]